MCLVLLHYSESTENNNPIHTKSQLHLLVISEDLLMLQRLLLYGASFAKRMIVSSPISELFASCYRDPFGSGTCMVNGKKGDHSTHFIFLSETCMVNGKKGDHSTHFIFLSETCMVNGKKGDHSTHFIFLSETCMVNGKKGDHSTHFIFLSETCMVNGKKGDHSTHFIFLSETIFKLINLQLKRELPFRVVFN